MIPDAGPSPPTFVPRLGVVKIFKERFSGIDTYVLLGELMVRMWMILGLCLPYTVTTCQPLVLRLSDFRSSSGCF